MIVEERKSKVGETQWGSAYLSADNDLRMVLSNVPQLHRASWVMSEPPN